MATLDEVRRLYPEYSGLKDAAFVDTIYRDVYQPQGYGREDFYKQLGGAAAPGVAGYASDIAKSAAVGVVKGTLGLADIPHLIETGLNAGNEYLVGKGIATPRERSPWLAEPVSPKLRAGIESQTGKFYEPQTTPGKYAQTVGEFVPGMIGGPAGIGTRAVTRALIPGVASEGLGQLAEKFMPKYETAARVGGALLGGVSGAVTERARASANVPSAAVQREASQQLYRAAEAEGVVITPQSFGGFKADLDAALLKTGIDPDLHPKAVAVWRRLDAEAASGKPVTLERAEILRRVMGDALESQSKSERNLIHVMRDKLDAYVGQLSQKDTFASATGGSAQMGAGLLAEARGLWSKQAKSEAIERLMTRAETRGKQFTGSGYENALRTEFRNFSNNENAMRGFSAAEKDAIQLVAKGGPIENLFRAMGRFAVRGPVSGLAAITAAGSGGTEAGLGLAAMGEVGRQGANALQGANARNAAEVMRGGKKLTPAEFDVLRSLVTSGTLSATRK